MSVPHPAPLSGTAYSPAELAETNDVAWVLEQRLLPGEERYIEVRDAATMVTAIREMWVRGAPAIGIAAAYGVALEARLAPGAGAAFSAHMAQAMDALAAARPTAVNLAWAVARMRGVVAEVAHLAPADRVARLAAEARRIHVEDADACREMGRLGAERVPDGATILTHCNAGALATGAYGTALGVIRAARDAGKRVRVLACETRPYWQGARLTAWELSRDGIFVELITDGMVGHFLSRGEISLAVVGSDRIARNGDVANKIGTYGHAVLCHAHGVPFYVAAPWSTVDLACPSGDAIPIEERSSREVTHAFGHAVAPEGVRARHPAFDVTPARYVTAIFTERGAVSPVNEAALARLGPR